MAKRLFFVLVLVVIHLVSINSLQAQNAWISTAESISLKKISGIPYQYYPELLDWVILTDNSSLVFIGDWDEDGDDYYLWVAQLNASGDIVQYSLINYLQQAFFVKVRAIWIPDEENPGNSFGLLFTSVSIPKNVLDLSQVRYFVTRFDATGKITQKPEPLLDIDLLPNQTFNGIWLGANLREGAVGVVMAFGIYEWSDSFIGHWGSQAYFLEYHLVDSISPAGVKRIKQKKDGKNWILHPYEPVWNGASWMIPAVETRIKIETQQGSTYGRRWSHKLMTLVATPIASGADIKIKKRTLERDNTRYDIPYKNPMFLPPNPVDLREESLSDKTVVYDHMLLYSKAIIRRDMSARELTAIDHEHYLRIVNARGKNIEPRYKLETPEWERKISAHPNWYVPENSDIFSNALFIENGRYFIARSRSAYFLHQADPTRSKSELQLDLYLFDPYTRIFERIAKQNLKGKFSSCAPILHFYTGAPCLINPLIALGSKFFPIDLFFSRF